MTFVNPLKDKIKGGIVQLTQDSCALGYVDKIDDFNALPCEEFYQRSVKTIVNTQSIRNVIVSSNFGKELSKPYFRDSFLELLADLGTKNVIVIGPTPYAPVNIGECFSKNFIFGFNESCDFEIGANNIPLNASIQEAVFPLKHVEFYDISEILCPDGVCGVNLNEPAPMYVDRGHLSLDAAVEVLDQLKLAQKIKLELE